MNKSSLRHLKLALLAGTCLNQSATAATVAETTDFGNSFATTTALPAGTDGVTGSLVPPTDRNDFFSFVSLLGGTAFSVSLNPGTDYFDFEVLSSTGSSFGSLGGVNQNSIPQSISGTIPADGVLVTRVTYNEGNAYTVNLTAASVPEPATALISGAGLAAMALRRRKNVAAVE